MIGQRSLEPEGVWKYILHHKWKIKKRMELVVTGRALIWKRRPPVDRNPLTEVGVCFAGMSSLFCLCSFYWWRETWTLTVRPKTQISIWDSLISDHWSLISDHWSFIDCFIDWLILWDLFVFADIGMDVVSTGRWQWGNIHICPCVPPVSRCLHPHLPLDCFLLCLLKVSHLQFQLPFLSSELHLSLCPPVICPLNCLTTVSFFPVSFQTKIQRPMKLQQVRNKGIKRWILLKKFRA